MYPTRPVRVTAFVPAQPETVLAFVVDTRNDPLWCQNVETAELLGPEPIGKGTRFRYRQHADVRGKRLTFDGEVEITTFDSHHVEWRVDDRYQVRDIVMEVSPEGRGSRVTQTTRASFKKQPGLARWLYPIGARRIFRSQFADLARHFEAPGQQREVEVPD